MTTRPEAVFGVGAALAAARWQAATAAESGSMASRYDAAMVIDALGGPGDFDPNLLDDAPLSPRALADAKASGVTAVNITVGEVATPPADLRRPYRILLAWSAKSPCIRTSL